MEISFGKGREAKKNSNSSEGTIFALNRRYQQRDLQSATDGCQDQRHSGVIRLLGLVNGQGFPLVTATLTVTERGVICILATRTSD